MPRKKKEDSKTIDPATVGPGTKPEDARYMDGSKAPVLEEKPMTVDWNERIPKDCLVINQGRTDETDIEKVSDAEKLITLEGFEQVAKERGWDVVDYPSVTVTENAVTVVCRIHWSHNQYGPSFISSGMGDATPNNTAGFGKNFLASIAENRAFERAVKKGLRIKVLGADEVKDARVGRSYKSENVNNKFADQMLDLMSRKGVTFEVVKNRLVAERFPGAADFEKVGDIPGAKILDLIKRLKKVKDKSK